MSRERLFLDTAFIQALLNPNDEYHPQAKQLFPRVRSASEVWLTEAILVEVGNALSRLNRNSAVSNSFSSATAPTTSESSASILPSSYELSTSTNLV
jgi:predicted nucleic acid-binding protein